jgi:glycosyltransferase involved in cell wall biosynthesis
MPRRPTVLFLTPHLGGGGAEAVIARLASHLNHEKYEVHLGVLAHAQNRVNTDTLPSHIFLHIALYRHVRNATLFLLKLTWRLRPELIVCGMAHLNLLVLLLRPFMPSRTRIIVRQNANLSQILPQGSAHSWIRRLYQSLYPAATRIICQSPEMAEDLSSILSIEQRKLVVLHNPIDNESIKLAVDRADSSWKGPGPHLLAIGRLADEKGIDILVRSVHALQSQFPSLDLIVLGEGPQAAKLKALVRSLSLESRVSFPGYVLEPAIFFRGAALFVHSSRREAMPNALLEAAAAGLPLVVTPASPALSNLLGNQPGVWLTMNCTSEALTETLANALRTVSAGQRFAHDWIEPFCLRNVIHHYENLLDALLLG